MKTFNKRHVLLGLLVVSLGLTKSWFQMGGCVGSKDLALEQVDPNRVPAQATGKVTVGQPKPVASGNRSATKNKGPAAAEATAAATPPPATPAPAAANAQAGNTAYGTPAPSQVRIINGNVVSEFKKAFVVSVDGKEQNVDMKIASEEVKDVSINEKNQLVEYTKSRLVATFSTDNCSSCIAPIVDIDAIRDLKDHMAKMKEHATTQLKKHLADKKKKENEEKLLADCKIKYVDNKVVTLDEDSEFDSERITCHRDRINRMTDASERQAAFSELIDNLQSAFHSDDPKERAKLPKLMAGLKGISDRKLKAQIKLAIDGMKDANRIIDLAKKTAMNPKSGLANAYALGQINAKYDSNQNVNILRGSESLQSAYADWHSHIHPLYNSAITTSDQLLEKYLPEWYATHIANKRDANPLNIPRADGTLNSSTTSGSITSDRARVNTGFSTNPALSSSNTGSLIQPGGVGTPALRPTVYQTGAVPNRPALRTPGATTWGTSNTTSTWQQPPNGWQTAPTTYRRPGT